MVPVQVLAGRASPSGMRGYTLPEVLLVVVLAGIVMAISVPRVRATLDRATVRAAAADVRSAIGMARTVAVAGQSAVAVEIDTMRATVRVRRGAESVWSRAIGDAHGVRLAATRDSMGYDAFGLGHGAANLSILVRRGSVAETVFVSRLGRIR